MLPTLLTTLLTLWHPFIPVRLERVGDGWRLSAAHWSKTLTGWGKYTGLDADHSSADLITVQTRPDLNNLAIPSAQHFFRASDGQEVLTGGFARIEVSGPFILADTLKPLESGEDVLDGGKLSFKVFDSRHGRWLKQPFAMPQRPGCGPARPAAVPEIDDLHIIGPMLKVNRVDGCGPFYVAWDWTKENAPAVVYRGKVGG